MHRVVVPFRICTMQLRRAAKNKRIWLIFLIMGFFMTELLYPVADFSKMTGVPVTPYAFPHLVNDFRSQLMMMGGAVILFCDAPFEGREYTYILPRSRRLGWAAGQVGYIVVLSFAYVLFLFASSVLPLICRVSFDMKWGKIWGTLAKTSAGIQIGLPFEVTEYLVSCYDAIPALVLSLVLEFACVLWLGLLTYALNKMTNRPVGTMAAAFMVLLDICIANDWMNWAYRFSPITLAQIRTYTGYNLQYHIDLAYGISFFVIGIFILSIVSILSNQIPIFLYRLRMRRRLR